jgi:hypothetical protein
MNEMKGIVVGGGVVVVADSGRAGMLSCLVEKPSDLNPGMTCVLDQSSCS